MLLKLPLNLTLRSPQLTFGARRRGPYGGGPAVNPVCSRRPRAPVNRGSGQPLGQGLHLTAEGCYLRGQGLKRDVTGRGHGAGWLAVRGPGAVAALIQPLVARSQPQRVQVVTLDLVNL